MELDKMASWLFWIIFAGLLYGVWLVFQDYVFPFFIALIIYLIFRKPYDYVLKIFRGKQNSASLVTLIAVLVIVVLPSFFLIRALIQEIAAFVTYFKSWLTQENLLYFNQNNAWLLEFMSKFDINIDSIRQNLLKFTTNIGGFLLEQGQGLLSGVLSLLFNFMITAIALFFLFRKGDQIAAFIYALLPFPDDIEAKVGKRLLEILDIMVKGTIFISLIQGTFLGIYFWLFGLPTPILYGALAAFFSLIPIVGTMAVWLPAAAYLYIGGYTFNSLLLSALCFTSYLALENILKPWILDKKLPLHPLFLFFAVLGGVTQFGIKGFILGPFVVMAFIIVLELAKAWGQEYEKK